MLDQALARVKNYISFGCLSVKNAFTKYSSVLAQRAACHPSGRRKSENRTREDTDPSILFLDVMINTIDPTLDDREVRFHRVGRDANAVLVPDVLFLPVVNRPVDVGIWYQSENRCPLSAISVAPHCRLPV